VPSGFLCVKLTTRFYSFTDGPNPSVWDSDFVGKFFTDEKCPSACLSSVIPHFVAKSVGKKKYYRRFYRRKMHAKKTFSLEIYRRIYFVGDSGISSNIFQLSVKCRRTLSVCEDVSDCGIFSKYFSSLGKMSMDSIHLWRHRWLWHFQ
jgi:hypothetical protein